MKKLRKLTKLKLGFIIISLLVLSCSNNEKEFTEAKNAGTIIAYQQFLENYSNSKYCNEIRQKLNERYKNLMIELINLSGGDRWNFGDRYKNNISVDVTKADGTKEQNFADFIAQEDALFIVQTDNKLKSEITQIGICKKLVFKIPDTLSVDNSKWLIRRKPITIDRIENGYLYPTDESEIPMQSGFVKDQYHFDYWTQAAGCSWIFIDKQEFETNEFVYSVISIPASIKFTRFGIELKNISRIKK
jgi:hypothetical protein